MRATTSAAATPWPETSATHEVEPGSGRDIDVEVVAADERQGMWRTAT